MRPWQFLASLLSWLWLTISLPLRRVPKQNAGLACDPVLLYGRSEVIQDLGFCRLWQVTAKATVLFATTASFGMLVMAMQNLGLIGMSKKVASSIVVLAGSIVFASTNGDITFATSLQTSSWRFGFGKARISIRTAGWILALLCTLPTASAQSVRHVLHSSCTSNTVCDVLQMHLNSIEFTVTDLFAFSATKLRGYYPGEQSRPFSESRVPFFSCIIRWNQKWSEVEHALFGPISSPAFGLWHHWMLRSNAGTTEKEEEKEKAQEEERKLPDSHTVGISWQTLFSPCQILQKTEG